MLGLINLSDQYYGENTRVLFSLVNLPGWESTDIFISSLIDDDYYYDDDGGVSGRFAKDCLLVCQCQTVSIFYGKHCKVFNL